MAFLRPDELAALLLSLKVSAVAVAASLPLAFAVALLLNRSFAGKTLLDGIVHLPLVLPPVAVGFILLMLFGTRGGLGALLSELFGIRLVFRWTGAALASAFITFPFQVRAIRLAPGSAGPRPERSRPHPGRRTGSTGFSTSPCRWRCRAWWRARSPPSPPRWASSAPSSPSSPTFPAKPAPCRWRSTAPCRRRAAKPKRRGCRRCPSSWRWSSWCWRNWLMRRATRQGCGVSVEARIRHRQGDFILDVAFRAPDGGVTALFGPSGAGKTSIVRALAGLTRPDHGRIAIGGELVLDTRGEYLRAARAAPRRPDVPGCAAVSPYERGGQSALRLAARAGSGPAPAEIAPIWSSLLGLGALLRRSPRHLSGGEKSRVALGRALLSSPRILLLDEPLASLDAERREEILPWLERLRDIARMPMIYVSHAVDEVARLADQVVLLRQGRVAAEGPASALLTGLASLAGARRWAR